MVKNGGIDSSSAAQSVNATAAAVPTVDTPSATSVTNNAATLNATLENNGGASITEPQLEAAYRSWLPVHSSACQSRLATFFRQWFDTAYAKGGGAARPTITGPGLAGQDFYGHAGCRR